MDRSTGLGEDDRGGISSGQTSTAQHSAAQETGGDVMAPAPASSAPVPVPTPTDRPAIAPRRPRVRLLALNISAVTQRSNGMYEPRVRMRVTVSAGRSITYQWRAPFFRHTEPPPCIYIYHDTTHKHRPKAASCRCPSPHSIPSPYTYPALPCSLAGGPPAPNVACCSAWLLCTL